MIELFHKFQWEINVLFPFHVSHESVNSACLRMMEQGFTLTVMPDMLILWENSSHKDVVGFSDGITNYFYPVIPVNETFTMEHEGVKFCEIKRTE